MEYKTDNAPNASITFTLREFSLVLGSSVLLGLLTNVLADLLLPNAEESLEKVIFIAITLVLIIISLYVIWRLMVVRKIERIIQFEIIYNPQDGEILPFMFESQFLPQDMARQVFAVLLSHRPEYRIKLQEDLVQKIADSLERSQKGHRLVPEDRVLFGECVEYLFLKWMAGWTGKVVTAGHRWGIHEKPIGYERYPEDLKKNTFITLMRTIEPTNIIERSLSQIELTMPSDYNLSYRWPRNEPRRSRPEPISGEYQLKGKYGAILIWFSNSNISHVTLAHGGRYPYLGEIPINLKNYEYIVNHPISKIGFIAGFSASFSAISLLYSRKARGHLELAQSLGESFVEDFDQCRFLQRAYERRQQIMFNDIGDKLATLGHSAESHATPSHEDMAKKGGADN